jgi:hypothetical protein
MRELDETKYGAQSIRAGSREPHVDQLVYYFEKEIGHHFLNDCWMAIARIAARACERFPMPDFGKLVMFTLIEQELGKVRPSEDK